MESAGGDQKVQNLIDLLAADIQNKQDITNALKACEDALGTEFNGAKTSKQLKKCLEVLKMRLDEKDDVATKDVLSTLKNQIVKVIHDYCLPNDRFCAERLKEVLPMLIDGKCVEQVFFSMSFHWKITEDALHGLSRNQLSQLFDQLTAKEGMLVISEMCEMIVREYANKVQETAIDEDFIFLTKLLQFYGGNLEFSVPKEIFQRIFAILKKFDYQVVRQLSEAHTKLIGMVPTRVPENYIVEYIDFLFKNNIEKYFDLKLPITQFYLQYKYLGGVLKEKDSYHPGLVYMINASELEKCYLDIKKLCELGEMLKKSAFPKNGAEAAKQALDKVQRMIKVYTPEDVTQDTQVVQTVSVTTDPQDPQDPQDSLVIRPETKKKGPESRGVAEDPQPWHQSPQAIGVCCGLVVWVVGAFVTTVTLIAKDIIQNFSRQELTSVLVSMFFVALLCAEVGMVISSIPKVSDYLNDMSAQNTKNKGQAL